MLAIFSILSGFLGVSRSIYFGCLNLCLTISLREKLSEVERPRETACCYLYMDYILKTSIDIVKSIDCPWKNHLHCLWKQCMDTQQKARKKASWYIYQNAVECKWELYGTWKYVHIWSKVKFSSIRLANSGGVDTATSQRAPVRGVRWPESRIHETFYVIYNTIRNCEKPKSDQNFRE